MSFSEGYGKNYGEIFEYDEAPVIAESTGGPRSNAFSSNAQSSSASRAIATERLSSSRYPSEISMDLSDLQDPLREDDDSNHRLQPGSAHSVRSDGPSSPLYQQLVSVEEDASCKSDDDGDDDDDDDDEFANDRCDGNDAHHCPLHELFQQNATTDFTAFYKVPNQQEEQQSHQQEYQQDHQQQQPSKTSIQQGESESWRSESTSSLITSQESSSRNVLQSSNWNSNRQRKVKFEISTRLEDIQEFEKPDIEDYHKLYYTAHELQRMIDGHRAEEKGKGRVER